MLVRLATFNVENMFKRPSIMNLPTWEDGKPVLEDYSKLSSLIQKPKYSKKDKTKMLSIMKRHGGLITQRKSKYLILNKIRGNLLKKPRGKPAQIIANGRNDWIGWFSLKKEAIKETAIKNTASVIKEVGADIVGIVEAEDRIVLDEFNDKVLPKVGVDPYNHCMLIDGNDRRGIDVGILSDYEIESIVSHVDDKDKTGRLIFSRDCPEYRIKISKDVTLLVLVNHFKSKGYGKPADSDKRRKRQAKQVADIYKKRLKQGFEYVAIIGDFNDTPDSDPLSPLLRSRPKLTDVMDLNEFISDGRDGTHDYGKARNKLDYILLSPKLVQLVDSAGIERRGVWPGKAGIAFPHFPEIKSKKDAASDHASLWVDLDL